MRRRWFWKVAGVAAVGLCVLGGWRAARAHGWGGDHTAHVQKLVKWHVGDVLDDLEASAEQRSRIDPVVDRVLQDFTTTHQGFDQLRGDLLALWRADAPDAARVHALVDERVAALRELAHRTADAVLEVHGTLSAEQRAQLAEEIESHHRD